jgi:hypothetical protein
LNRKRKAKGRAINLPVSLDGRTPYIAELIEFQLAVQAMARPSLMNGTPYEGAPARIGGAQAASMGLGGRIGSGWRPKMVRRSDGTTGRQA